MEKISITLPLLVALMTVAHHDAMRCFQDLDIDSCEACNARAKCNTKRTIEEGEKILEQI